MTQSEGTLEPKDYILIQGCKSMFYSIYKISFLKIDRENGSQILGYVVNFFILMFR